jgi:hypothetical protein
MKQWPKAGSKVKFTGTRMFRFVNMVKDANELLEIGKEYTITKIELASSWCGVILDEFPQYSYWSHENHQRDHIYNCINKLAQDDDIIFISDLDEIWDPEKIIPILSNTDSNKIYRWRSRICYFYFNLIAQKEDWIQPMFLSFSLLKELIEKKQYSISQNILRDIHSPINIYTDEYSGWHFSYTGPVIYKLQNFLHSEFNNLSEDYIKECVETKINPFYKNKMQVIGASEFNSYLPKYVMNNLQKYKKYLLQ